MSETTEPALPPAEELGRRFLKLQGGDINGVLDALGEETQ